MSKVAIVVGRFQDYQIHSGYSNLFKQIAAIKPNRLVIFLGVPVIGMTKRNPLDFQQREIMVRENLIRYGLTSYVVLPLSDMQDDAAWSKGLDKSIASVTNYGDEITLYHSRDGFVESYSGKFNTVELPAFEDYSSTKDREAIKNAPRLNEDFRAGIVYATQNTFNHARVAVDIAVLKGRGFDTEILMGRKDGETSFRLIGGFVDAEDNSLEYTVRRELLEETGLNAETDSNITYIGSYKIDDWRFRGITEYSVMSSLFVVDYLYGAPKAADDIVEVKWIKLQNAVENTISTHKKLVNRVYEYKFGK